MPLRTFAQQARLRLHVDRLCGAAPAALRSWLISDAAWAIWLGGCWLSLLLSPKDAARGEEAPAVIMPPDGLAVLQRKAAANARRLAAGVRHSVAVRDDGKLRCWGVKENYSDDNVDVPIERVRPWQCSAVAVNNHRTLALLRRDGGVLLWENQQVVGMIDEGAIDIAAAFGHFLILKKDGTVVYQGNNMMQEAPPPDAVGPYTAVAAGHFFSALLRKGGIDFFGNNSDGQAPPEGLDGDFAAVSCGGKFTLALHTDGRILCLGDNEYGQAPSEGVTSGPFVAIAAGYRHSLALRADGSVACFGDNRAGQAPPTGRAGPYIAVAAGAVHSLGLRADGHVDCWGSANESGMAPPEGVDINA